MARTRRGISFDHFLAEGWAGLAGVDEAGRGALAGPVVAAAVAVQTTVLRHRSLRQLARLVDDSKKLDPARREEVLDRMGEMTDGLVLSGVGQATAAEVEEHNVLGATRVAMTQAIEELNGRLVGEGWVGVPPAWDAPSEEPTLGLFSEEGGDRWGLLIDGRPLRPFRWPHCALVGGDGRSFLIGLASIVAKVTRDRRMEELAQTFPEYGFAAHKGYGTARHWAALRTHGPTPEHRLSFLRKGGGRFSPEVDE